MSVTLERGGEAVKEVCALLQPNYAILSGSTALEGVGADADIVVYAVDAELAVERLEGAGYTPCGLGAYSMGDRSVWRNGDINVILCHTLAEYQLWLRALLVCASIKEEYGYTTKEIRAIVHKAMRGEDV